MKPPSDNRSKSTPPPGALRSAGSEPAKGVRIRDYNAAVGNVELKEIKLVELTFQVKSQYWKTTQQQQKFSFGVQLGSV